MKYHHKQAFLNLLIMALSILVMNIPGQSVFAIGVFCLFFGIHLSLYVYHVSFYPFLEKSLKRETRLFVENMKLKRKYVLALELARKKKEVEKIW